MITRFIIWFTVLFLLGTYSSLAQEELQVLRIIGEVKWQMKSGGEWNQVVKGTRVKEGELLELKEGSSLIVKNSNSSCLELDKPGQYEVSELVSSINATFVGSMSGLFMYWWKELNHPHVDILQEYEKNMEVAGVTSRGLSSPLFPISGSVILDEKVTFRWPGDLSGNYTIIVADSNKQQVGRFQTGDTLVTINLVDLGVDKPGVYYWKVYSEENNYDPVSFVQLNESDSQILDQKLKEGEMQFDLSSLDGLVSFGKFCESKHLYIECKNAFDSLSLMLSE